LAVVVTSHLQGRRDRERRADEAKAEESKHKHEASVRFHDERLEVYVEYLGAVTNLYAVARVWISNGSTGSLAHFASGEDALTPYTKAMTRVSLLCKSELLTKQRELHGYVAELLDPQPADALLRLLTKINAARSEFEVEAKKELGIS
jgi:hypothetical protein